MSRTTYAPKQTYTGDNTLAVYTFAFKIEVNTHLEVVEVDASGVETQRVLGNDAVYLSGVVFDAVAGGGTVTLASNLATGYRLILLLANDDPTQSYEFRNKSSFTLKRFEAALDFISGQVQRLAYRGKQAFRIHDLDDEETFDAQLPSGIASNGDKILVVNTAGTGMEFGPDVATIIASGVSAAASAAAALASENAAATSESNAATSESNAATSETNAGTSETNAAASEAAAAQSAIDAAAAAAAAVGWDVIASAAIAAAGSITQGTTPNQLLTVTGSGGAITTGNAPLGAVAPTEDGTQIRIKGDSDTNTVTIPYSDTAKGFYLNGDVTLGKYDQVTVQWDATNDRYFETSRNV